ncbi:proteoglycan 4-like [Schistocerca americana]|uniref:proteoglycan 4-like n=1 Tax=Schistocerca americana TaxID=7009 RepID=UPI001F4F8286|nr:proteoglycan 4-like [Schistocerca americana]XP_046985261.1 proteoglycan 4-like [Schistocerca americana]
MAASQTGLSASVSTAKTDQSEDNEAKEDQKTHTQSAETKEHGSESTYHETPNQESKNVNTPENKETGLEEKLTSEDNKETTKLGEMESKSVSEVHDTKASTDLDRDDRKLVGDNHSKTKSVGGGETIKQAESSESKTALSLETTKDDSEEASVSARNIESKETEDDTKKIPDDKHSEKEVGEDPKDSPAGISDGKTERTAGAEKSSETPGDKGGEDTAPSKDDGIKSDIQNVAADEDTVSKDAGVAVGTESQITETPENKGADNVVGMADDKDEVCAKKSDDTSAADNKEATEQTKEDKNEPGKEPDAEPEEPLVPKIPNGVASKGKGRRKGTPKRAVPDDTPEPSTSSAETKSTRTQPAKKETAQPSSKKRKAPEEQRAQPTRRSKRRKVHGWGAKRKTRSLRDQ